MGPTQKVKLNIILNVIESVETKTVLAFDIVKNGKIPLKMKRNKTKVGRF